MGRDMGFSSSAMWRFPSKYCCVELLCSWLVRVLDLKVSSVSQSGFTTGRKTAPSNTEEDKFKRNQEQEMNFP